MGKEARVDNRTQAILMAEEPPGAGGVELLNEEIDYPCRSTNRHASGRQHGQKPGNRTDQGDHPYV